MADSKGHLRSTHSSSNIINSKPSLRLKAVGMVSPLLVLWLFLVTHSTGMLPQCHSPNSSTMHRHMMLRIYRSRHISSNTGQAVMTIAMVPPTQEEVLLVLLLIGEEVEHKWMGKGIEGVVLAMVLGKLLLLVVVVAETIAPSVVVVLLPVGVLPTTIEVAQAPSNKRNLKRKNGVGELFVRDKKNTLLRKQQRQ